MLPRDEHHALDREDRRRKACDVGLRNARVDREAEALGKRLKRLLWASTSTKNPTYSKLLYVETLIGADTVNTVPTETYNEIMQHGDGHIAESLTKDIEGAVATIQRLEEAGVSMKAVTDKLLDDGVAAFMKSFDTLLPVVHDKRKQLAKG